jgi:hypothetical protein
MSRTVNLPIVDISFAPVWDGLARSVSYSAAATVVDALRRHGLVLVRPDVPFTAANQDFLQKMVAFFRLPEAVKRHYVVELAGVKYEVGYMPSHAEHAQEDAEYGQFIAKITNPADLPVPHVGSNPIARHCRAHLGRGCRYGVTAKINHCRGIVGRIKAAAATRNQTSSPIQPQSIRSLLECTHREMPPPSPVRNRFV